MKSLFEKSPEERGKNVAPNRPLPLNPLMGGGNAGPRAKNPDPTDETAYVELDYVADFQRIRERLPVDPPEEFGDDLEVERFAQAVELNRWNTINPVPDGDEGPGGAGDTGGDTTPTTPINPVADPPGPETDDDRDPRPPRPEPLPIF